MPEHTKLEIDRQKWRRKNRGILREIAQRLDYSAAMVSLVFNGHKSSFDGSIEQALREADAPGWPRKKGQGKEP